MQPTYHLAYLDFDEGTVHRIRTPHLALDRGYFGLWVYGGLGDGQVPNDVLPGNNGEGWSHGDHHRDYNRHHRNHLDEALHTGANSFPIVATFLSPPPPPQQQQEQQQQQPEAEIQSTPRGPKWVVIGALLLLVVVETLRGMPSAPSSEGMAYRVGYGVGGAILNLVPILAVSLVAGASPVETRVGRSEATLSATLYSWPIAAVVVVSTLIALLI